MPKIIALAALALLLPLGAVQYARANDAQEFESWRMRDDMHRHLQYMEGKRGDNRHWRGMKFAQVETVAFEAKTGEGQKAEDSLLLFALDGEPSRSETYRWAQEPPETGTFLFQWTYTYKGEDYTASSIELDVGFISKDSKTYLALTQRRNNDRDFISNAYPEHNIYPRNIYAAFLNRAGLHFRFNPERDGAAYFSRFRNIRITLLNHER